MNFIAEIASLVKFTTKRPLENRKLLGRMKASFAELGDE